MQIGSVDHRITHESVKFSLETLSFLVMSSKKGSLFLGGRDHSKTKNRNNENNENTTTNNNNYYYNT